MHRPYIETHESDNTLIYLFMQTYFPYQTMVLNLKYTNDLQIALTCSHNKSLVLPTIQPQETAPRNREVSESNLLRAHAEKLCLPPLPAAPLNDLYSFNPSTNTWTAIYPSGSTPSPRYLMGFAVTPDSMLYVFGGATSFGKGSWGCSSAGCMQALLVACNSHGQAFDDQAL